MDIARRRSKKYSRVAVIAIVKYLIIKSTLKTHFERNRRLEVVDVEKDC